MLLIRMSLSLCVLFSGWQWIGLIVVGHINREGDWGNVLYCIYVYEYTEGVSATSLEFSLSGTAFFTCICARDAESLAGQEKIGDLSTVNLRMPEGCKKPGARMYIIYLIRPWLPSLAAYPAR